MLTEAVEKCCSEGCGEPKRKNKLFCDHHYIIELESKIEWVRDKVFDYEKQTIPELNEKLKITIKALDSIVDGYFDLPPEMRMKKGIKESKESLTAKAALKMIGAR